MTKTANQPMTEDALQQNVVQLLSAYGRSDICWFAVPNGERRGLRTGVRLKAQGVIPGVADIILMINQKIYGLELKTIRGKQSAVQERWQECFERAGGIYAVANGLDDAFVTLKSIGALKPNIKFQFSGDRASA
jgi:hypothetical protein